jgi:SAM-dependent methyltransferase
VTLETAPRPEASGHLGIACGEADAAATSLLEEEAFDAVACNFRLSDTGDLCDAFANLARLLRPGGRLVFCILHPCLPGAARASASWPAVGTYHDEAWWLSADEPSSIRYQVGTTHWTVSLHLNAFVDSGLVADRVAEPPADGEWANERPGTAGTAMYLVVRALSPPSPSVRLP